MALEFKVIENVLRENGATIEQINAVSLALSESSVVKTREGVDHTLGINDDVEIISKDEIAILRKKVESFEAILKSVPELVYVKDKDLNYTVVSESLVKYFGVKSADELIGQKRSDIYNDPTLTDEDDDIKILENGAVIDSKLREIHSDDGVQYISCTKAPQYDEEGNIVGIIGISRNITEKRINQMKLERNTEILDIVPDGIIQLDAKTGDVIGMNEACKNIFDISNISELRDTLNINFPGINISNYEAMNSIHSSIFKLDGNFSNFQINSKLTADNEVIVLTFHDLANRVRISNFINTISEKGKSIDNLNDFYAFVHESLKILFSADNFCIVLYDDKNNEIEFTYFSDSIDKENPGKKKLGRGCTEYVIRKKEAVLIDRDEFAKLEEAGEIELIGSSCDYWLGAPMLDNKGNVKGVLVVQSYNPEYSYTENDKALFAYASNEVFSKMEEIQLIEAEKKEKKELVIQQIKLRESNNKLSKANAESEKFFGIIAHDLNSPFQGISGVVEILNEEIESVKDYLLKLENPPDILDLKNKSNSDSNILHFIKNLNFSVANYSNLLQNLLSWARLKLKGIDEPKEHINLKTLIDSIEKNHKIDLDKKGITLMNALSNEDMVFQSSAIIKTVFNNLISNARKFCNQYGIIIISLEEKNENYIKLKVSDNGVGMSKDKIAKVFNVSEKTTTLGTADEKGSGLGLPLCYGYMKEIGGDLTVDSEEGKGSTFYVKIPLK